MVGRLQSFLFSCELYLQIHVLRTVHHQIGYQRNSRHKKNLEIIECARGACAVHDNVPYENEFHWEEKNKPYRGC